MGQEEPEPIIKLLKRKIEENAARGDGTSDVDVIPTSRIVTKDQTELLEDILGELKEMNLKLDQMEK